MKKLKALEIIILVIGGLILWNTWVFGWLNHGLAGYTRMSISELNVSGQPYALFFSGTELLSGLFLLVSGLGLTSFTKKSKLALVVLALVALIGGLTIFDAVRPVDCNRYQNPACVAKIASGQLSASDRQHGTESRITDYATGFLALALIAWALAAKMPGRELAIVVVLAIGVIATSVIGSDSIVYDSISQRVWNVLVSFDFLFVAYKLKLRQYT